MAPTNCNGCGKPINSLLYMECSKCTELYDLECVKLPADNFTKLTDEDKKIWLCPQCICSRPKTGDTSTPIRTLNNTYTSTNNINTTRGSRSKLAERKTTVTLDPISQNMDLCAFMERMEMKFDELTGTIQNLELSLNGRMEGMAATINKLTTKLEEMETRVDNLNQSNLALRQENKDLRKELQKIHDIQDDLEQRSRNVNLEIQNVPEKKSENLIHLVEALGNIIGVPILADQVTDVHRVSHNVGSDRPKNIVVHLTTRRLRNDVIAAVRARRGLTYGQLRRAAEGATTSEGKSNSNDERKVYVNEHLTLRKKMLYAKTRSTAKSLHYKYVWIKNSTILIRKDDTTKIMSIRHDEDLQRL